MGSDADFEPFLKSFYISIHTPRMGSDRLIFWLRSFYFQFQSTLPAWGVTRRQRAGIASDLFQSTLPAWGVTVVRSLLLR